MRTLLEVVDILDQQFLEWSRAKERNDTEGMQNAIDTAMEAAEAALLSGLSLLDVMNLHKSHKTKLVLIRASERALRR